MKKLFHFNGMLWQTKIIAIMASICIASGQTEKKQHFPIPENINKIFQTSCMPCHGDNGGRLPKSKLYFSRWAGYGTTKEAEKASFICSSVRKGEMPPKSVRDSKPDLIPTKEQVDLICNWAESSELHPHTRRCKFFLLSSTGAPSFQELWNTQFPHTIPGRQSRSLLAG